MPGGSVKPDDGAAAYLLTIQRAVEAGLMTTREALQRAFEAGRMKGRPEGIAIAQEIIGRPEATK